MPFIYYLLHILFYIKYHVSVKFEGRYLNKFLVQGVHTKIFFYLTKQNSDIRQCLVQGRYKFVICLAYDHIYEPLYLLLTFFRDGKRAIDA